MMVRVFSASESHIWDMNERRPLGRRLRIEHEDNAYLMGAAAGRIMAAARSAPRRCAYIPAGMPSRA